MKSRINSIIESGINDKKIKILKFIFSGLVVVGDDRFSLHDPACMSVWRRGQGANMFSVSRSERTFEKYLTTNPGRYAPDFSEDEMELLIQACNLFITEARESPEEFFELMQEYKRQYPEALGFDSDTAAHESPGADSASVSAAAAPARRVPLRMGHITKEEQETFEAVIGIRIINTPMAELRGLLSRGMDESVRNKIMRVLVGPGRYVVELIQDGGFSVLDPVETFSWRGGGFIEIPRISTTTFAASIATDYFYREESFDGDETKLLIETFDLCKQVARSAPADFYKTIVLPYHAAATAHTSVMEAGTDVVAAIAAHSASATPTPTAAAASAVEAVPLSLQVRR